MTVYEHETETVAERAYDAEEVRTSPKAGFWRRLVAYVLDGLVLAVANGVLQAVFEPGLASALGVALGLAYFAVQEGGERGQTLGKRALGIRVFDVRTGRRIGYGRAVIRYVSRILSTLPLLLGYLWMIWDGKKQTWHDKLAATVVVRT
jgi:uncharacterized RDD family membrane protein YckC